MFTQYGRIVRGLVIVGLTAFIGVNAFAQDDPCERDAETFYLKIKIKNNTPTEVIKGDKNADELDVCRGDTIEWKLQHKEFYIEFVDGTPLDSDSKNSSNGKITAEVSDSAERDTSYKYDIGIEDGGTLDPKVRVK